MTLKSVDALSNCKNLEEIHQREIKVQAKMIKKLTNEKYECEREFKDLFRLFDGYKTDLKIMTELKLKVEKEKKLMTTELR